MEIDLGGLGRLAGQKAVRRNETEEMDLGRLGRLEGLSPQRNRGNHPPEGGEGKEIGDEGIAGDGN